MEVSRDKIITRFSLGVLVWGGVVLDERDDLKKMKHLATARPITREDL
jgi:hypothetical protein